MAIDEISESVHRQERPLLRFPPKIGTAETTERNVIILGSSSALESSMLLSHVPAFHASRQSTSSRPSAPTPEPLWPPLKGARYCKKLQKRAEQRKGLNAANMFLHEGSINHTRFSQVLDEIVFADSSALVTELSVRDSSCFWSQQACQEFWDEYLKCDFQDFAPVEASQELATMTIDTKACYRRVCSSIRRLLKSSVRGTRTFSDLEDLVLAFHAQSKTGENFSCGQVVQQDESTAVVRLITPFHRVWLHAICQFYGFPSHSKTVDNDRLVTIQLGRKQYLAWPEERLADFLVRM